MIGRVIVLNGTSSSGKSTLAAALQDRLVADGSPWIVMATDDTFAKLPAAFIEMGEHHGAHAALGVTFRTVDGVLDVRMGRVAQQLFDAHAGMVAASVRAGISVIVDDVVLYEEQYDRWRRVLDGFDVCWVRLDVPLDVLEAREQERGDRVIGMARSQFDIVHRIPTYDLAVDTGRLDADAAADHVYDAVSSPLRTTMSSDRVL